MPRLHLVAERLEHRRAAGRRRRRPPRPRARANAGFSLQKAVPGVDRLRARLAHGVDDGLDVQVRVLRRRRPDEHRLVGVGHVGRLAVGLGVDRDRPDAEALARAHHATRDLAPVGDQDLVERLARGQSARLYQTSARRASRAREESRQAAKPPGGRMREAVERRAARPTTRSVPNPLRTVARRPPDRTRAPAGLLVPTPLLFWRLGSLGGSPSPTRVHRAQPIVTDLDPTRVLAALASPTRLHRVEPSSPMPILGGFAAWRLSLSGRSCAARLHLNEVFLLVHVGRPSARRRVRRRRRASRATCAPRRAAAAGRRARRPRG